MIEQLRAICGGRYDGLLSTLGGKDLPATGFGFGDMVIAELLSDKNLIPRLSTGNEDIVIPLDKNLRHYGGCLQTKSIWKICRLVLMTKR